MNRIPPGARTVPCCLAAFLPTIAHAAEPLAQSLLPVAVAGAVLVVCASAAFTWMWRRQRALLAERVFLRNLIRTIPDLVWLKDPRGVYLACNSAFEALFGASEQEIIGRTDYDFVSTEQADDFRRQDKLAQASGRTHVYEEWVTIATTGERALVETSKTALRDGRGRLLGILGISHNITQRHLAQVSLKKSNRALRLLSDINQTLIRCESEQELLTRACEILVGDGGYMLAWVGYAQQDEDRTILPVASAGEGQEYLTKHRISWGDNPHGHGPTGTAIRTGKPSINRDTQSNDSMAPWRENALTLGFHASIALPMQPFGALCLYTRDAGQFEEEEIGLLTELAEDLAFGVHTLRIRAAHDRAERALAGQKQALEMVASGKPLSVTLDTLVRLCENLVSDMRASILLLTPDGLHLRHGAAPSMSQEYLAAVDGAAIGPAVGSCGTAAYRRSAVIVEDTLTDPLWANYQDLAIQSSIRACWSTPIFDTQEQLLGTLAFYFETPRTPDTHHQWVMDMATQTAAIAITRHNEETALRRSELGMATAQSLAHLGSWEYDADSNTARWSAEMYRLFGMQPGEPLREHGPWFLDRLHPEDRHFFNVSRDVLNSLQENTSIHCRSNPLSGPIRHFNVVISPVRDGNGRMTGLTGTMQDVTAQRAQEARIEQLAFYDSLTGLPHRTLFLDRLQQALAVAERGRQQVALLFLDLDRFKEINDSQGHDAGDHVLVEVSQRLQAVLRHDETLARLGGDEFTVIVQNTTEAGAALVAERIIACFRRPFQLGGSSFSLGVSIGVAMFPDDGDSTQTLLSRADMAMYQAKSRGGGSRFYQPDMSAQLASRLALAQGLERALAGNLLSLHYQPQVCLTSGKVIGAEALLRWQDPQRGWISPAEFIPVAEERGMMGVLGDWVLAEAARQLRAWQDMGTPCPGRLSVNVSAKQLGNKHFVESTLKIMARYQLPPTLIELELTESTLMADADRAITLMDELKSHGFALAIDDFGTGYSSLIYLKQLPADRLKIDMSFVRDMLTDRNDYAIVTTIIAMARSLGLRTIAEGVEGAPQADALQALGCDEVQGYHFGRPVPAEEFARLWLQPA